MNRSPNETRAGRRARRIARSLAAGLVLAMLGACAPPTNTYVAPPPPKVTVGHPVRARVLEQLEYTGRTEAFEAVELRARVAGFLEKVCFKPGARVSKGDVLFVIDRRPFEAAVQRLEAELLAAEATSKAAETDARIAEELAAQRAGSEIDKVTKIGRRDSSKAAIEAAKAAVATARLDLEFCDVRAPIDGRITKNLVDVGNLVGSSGQATVLATLVRSKPIYVSVDVSDSDVLTVRRRRLAKDSRLEPGQIAEGEWRPVDIAIGSSGEFSIHGHVDYVDPVMNPQSGTLRVRCRFENEDEFLLPGLFVRVRFPMEETDATLAPDIALLSDQGGRFAYVVNAQNAVELRRVKVGALQGSLRVVSEGLSPSDQIVVNGLQRARPGIVVDPSPESAESRATSAPTR